MLGRSTGAVLFGVDARLVEVEVDLSGGLPTIAAVGLPDPAVREGVDRVRSALRHSGFKLPQSRVVINLAPAELRKQGAALDLPIAVALLLADGQLPAFEVEAMTMAGELGLDGSVRPVRGALAIALASREAGRRTVLLPRDNAEEAALVAGLEVVPIGSLADLVAVSRGKRSLWRTVAPERQLALAQATQPGPDLADVRGQASARRAIEIAAAGGHHLLLSGPPGTGKSMLARRLPGIMPPMSVDEALTVTRIHGAAGLCRGLVGRRPLRAPHHGISMVGLTGGGPAMRPGEISLASHGALYLDELTEFRRDALEALRQPVEDGSITVVRVHGAVTFPAEFTLVASMNPCRCGHHGDPRGRCCCSPTDLRRYRARISGPLLDRFDLVVDVPSVDPAALSAARAGEGSQSVRARVVEARRRQRERFGRRGPTCNARMGPSELNRYVTLEPACRRLLVQACHRLGLSARGFDRVCRVARTLADLEGKVALEEAHLVEALQYRHPASGQGD